LKSIGCEVPEKKSLLYSPDVSSMTITFHPSSEVFQSLPLPAEVQDQVFLMMYGNTPSAGDNYGMIFNRYENGLGAI
jgi:hypothetical protein